MLTADIAFIAALAVMVGCNLYFSPRIGSERIVVQWGFDGHPRRFASKRWAMWGMVALAVAVRLVIYLAMTYTPDKVHGPEIGLLFFSIIIAGAHVYTLVVAARTR
jgi:hypothetical protein